MLRSNRLLRLKSLAPKQQGFACQKMVKGITRQRIGFRRIYDLYAISLGGENDIMMIVKQCNAGEPLFSRSQIV
jgi:hypothetical protein